MRPRIDNVRQIRGSLYIAFQEYLTLVLQVRTYSWANGRRISTLSRNFL